MASGDLDESKIAAIVATKISNVGSGVSTEQAPFGDAPSMNPISMVEIKHNGEVRYTSRVVPIGLPPFLAQTTFRYQEFDLLGCIMMCGRC